MLLAVGLNAALVQGHDPQTVLELEFTASGRVQEVYWTDTFTIDLAV